MNGIPAGLNDQGRTDHIARGYAAGTEREADRQYADGLGVYRPDPNATAVVHRPVRSERARVTTVKALREHADELRADVAAGRSASFRYWEPDQILKDADAFEAETERMRLAGELLP